jgi:hypothetical protein
VEALRGDRRIDREDRRQRLELDAHQSCRATRDLLVLGDDPRERLAVMADLVGRDQRLVVQDRPGVVDPGHAARGQHTQHARHRQRRAGVDAEDPGMRHLRLHRIQAQHALRHALLVGVDRRPGDVAAGAFVLHGVGSWAGRKADWSAKDAKDAKKSERSFEGIGSSLPTTPCPLIRSFLCVLCGQSTGQIAGPVSSDGVGRRADWSAKDAKNAKKSKKQIGRAVSELFMGAWPLFQKLPLRPSRPLRTKMLLQHAARAQRQSAGTARRTAHGGRRRWRGGRRAG